MEPRIDDIQMDLQKRIEAVRARTRRLEISSGLLLVALVSLGAGLLVLLLEGIVRFDAPSRTILFWLPVVSILGLLGWHVVRPILKLLGIIHSESDQAVAEEIGRAFPGVNDRIVNGLDLFAERSRIARYYSADLVDASLRDLQRDITPLDFLSVVRRSSVRQRAQAAGVAAVVVILAFALFPSFFLDSAYRLLHHHESFTDPAPFRFLVEPGDKEVVKGENVRVTVRIEGRQQQQVILSARRKGETAFEEQTLEKNPDDSFAYHFFSLRSSTVYGVRSGTIRSREYTLEVIDRPVVKILRLTLDFPRYSGLPVRQLEENVGDVTALCGTRIAVSLEANKELADARILFSDSTELEMNIVLNKASVQMILTKERTYHIALHDREGAASADPIEYSLHLLPDAYPSASIIVPGINVDVTDNTSLPMLFKIADDYGFSKLRLAYRLVQSRYEKPREEFTDVEVPLPGERGTDLTIPYTWVLTPLRLVSEDVVQYYLEVFDNDMVSGPKSAKSETYTLRLPSLEEVLADVDKEHDRALEGMKDALTQMQEAKRQMEELRQDLKKEQQKVDWQDQKKAEDLLKKYDEITKTMEEVHRTVDQITAEMQKNQVLSHETLEKYQELQQLLQAMNSPEMADAMKKLQQALQQMNPDAMRQALQQFSFSEENFRKSIERTMNLLRRIQIEQKLDEMVKRAVEIRKKQQDVLERTSNADRNRMQDLAHQQEDLKQDVGNLRREMEELQKNMEEFPGEMPVEQMAEARRETDESRLDDQMQEIARQMREMQVQQAAEGQKQAQEKLGQISQRMQEVKSAMQQNQQRAIVNEMRHTLQDLLALSQRQEALKNESRGLDPNSARFRESAQKQMEVMRDLGNITDRLSRLANKSFSISPEMGKSIGDAMQHMSDAMQSLDQRNGSAAGQQESSAMASLNEAAQQVQSAVQAMMQGGGQGMGMAGLMQRLQQMTSRQQGINEETQNMGTMSAAQAAEMARLAGEQGMVRKSLEELAREAATSGQMSRMLGDLKRIAEEMRDVQTDLAQGEINPETIQKQDRILSRLLDSQRSMRERDFEQRRKAETGTNVTRTGPGKIDLSTKEGKDRLRRDLMRALEEGYARDYEELIKRYFEVLNQ